MSDEGRRLRDEGMARVDSHALPPWKAVFDMELDKLARSGREFTAEDVTRIVGMPAHPNAVGARFSAAKRRGVIREIGFRQAERGSRHASRQLVWVGTGSGTYVPTPTVTKVEKGWRCGSCNTKVDERFVTPSPLDPRFGSVSCSTCLKRRQAIYG